MIQIDKAMIKFFKHFYQGCGITFSDPDTPALTNNIFIPPEILLLNNSYKNVNVILTVTQSKMTPDNSKIKKMYEMLNSVNSLNTLIDKDNNEYNINGIPVLTHDKELQGTRIVGKIVDIDLIEQSEKKSKYNVTLYLKAVQ